MDAGPRAEPGGAVGLFCRGAPAACAAAALWVVLIRISPLATAAKWDEFIYVYDAQRILGGQVPYRDFFQFTPPGDLLAFAAWFKLFAGAASLTLGRYLAAAVALACGALAARALTRASWSRPAAWALGALLPVGLYPFWAVPSHHWLAALVMLASLEAYDFGRERVRGGWGWLAAGAAIGASFIVLQTAFAVMAALWGCAWLLQEGRRWSRAALIATGAALTAGPVLLWLAFNRALGPFLRDTVLWTYGHYGREGGVNAVRMLQDVPDRLAALWRPVPGVAAWARVPLAAAGSLVYVGILALALALAAAVVAFLVRSLAARRLPGGLRTAAALALAVAAALFLRGKTDWLHLVYLLGPAGILWLAAAGPRGVPGWLTRSVGRWGLAALLSLMVLFQSSYLFFHRPALWEFADVDRPTREAPLNRYLRAQPWLLPADTLAAFPEGGEVYLYVRPAAVGYTLLYPPGDRYYGPGDYAAVASQMALRRPRCVVLTADTEAQFLAPDCPIGALLRGSYDRVGRIADAVIYRLRPTP